MELIYNFQFLLNQKRPKIIDFNFIYKELSLLYSCNQNVNMRMRRRVFHCENAAHRD